MGALVSFALYESFRFLKEPGSPNLMGAMETTVMVFGSLMISGLLIYLGHRYFSVRLNVPVAIVMSVLFLGNMMAILLFPSSWTDPKGVTYLLEGDTRFAYIISYGAELLFMYIFLGMGPQVQKGDNGFAFVLEFIIIAAIVGVVYSYITEWDKYVNYFTAFFAGEPMPPRENIKSFTYICNTYGALLFYGGVAELAFHHHDRKPWRIFVSIFFFLNCWVVQSKTTTISFGLLLILYLILNGFILIKEKKTMRGILHLSFIFTILGASVILYFFPTVVRDLVNNFWDHYVFSGESTFTSRIHIWQHIFGVLQDNPTMLVFGIGNTNFFMVMRFALDYVFPTAAAHNGFMEVLGRGGIIAVLAYTAFFVYYVVIFIKLIKKKHTRHYWFYAIFLLAYLARSIAESEALITPDWNGILACVFGVFPVFSAYFGMDKTKADKPMEFHVSDLCLFVWHMLPGITATVGFVLVSLGLSLDIPVMLFAGLLIQLLSFIWMGIRSKRNDGVFWSLLVLLVLDIYLYTLQYLAVNYFPVDKVYMATIFVVYFYGLGIISSIFMAELLPIESAIEHRDLLERKYEENRW